jgi:hypothetical protein
MSDLNWNLDGPIGSTSFQTDWFVVNAAGRSTPETAGALDKLCSTYWYPLYAYVRRKGHAPQDAQDLTQEFFSRLLESPWLRDVHPSKGKFRSFLLASMNHFLANEWRRNQTQKRGGGRAIFFLEAAAVEDRHRLQPAQNEEFWFFLKDCAGWPRVNRWRGLSAPARSRLGPVAAMKAG